MIKSQATTAMLATVMLAATMITSAQASGDAHATAWPITLDANCNVLPSGHSWSELSPAAGKKQLDEIREKVALCERTQNGTLPDYREEIRRFDSDAKIDLLVGYRFYALVKYCHEIREGYLSVYINNVEMRRADKAIRAIVQKAVSEYNSIDTDKIWNLALRQANNQPISRSYCEMQYYQALLNASPIDPLNIRKPK